MFKFCTWGFLCLSLSLQSGAQNLQQSPGCNDTLELKDHYTRSSKLTNPKLNNGDYMLGTNGKYTMVAQRFNNTYKNDPDTTKKLRVAGLEAYFLKKKIVSGVDVTRKIEIYKAGADMLPEGGPLLQQIFATSDLKDPSGSTPAVTPILFDQSVPVGRDDFFIAFEVANQNSDDTIGFYSNFPSNGKGEKRAVVYKKSESKWVFLQTEENYDADVMIIALVAEDCSSSIEENDLINKINVYPNPAGNVIYLSIEMPGTDVLEITILDYIGKVVMYDEAPAFSEDIPVDLSSLNRGIYLLRIKYQNQYLTKQIFKN